MTGEKWNPIKCMPHILQLLVFLIVTGLIYSCSAKPIQSSFPLPEKNKPSEFIYVSSEYRKYLMKTKSHPQSIYNLSGNRSPILFYQKSNGKFHESPNLHEGGTPVDLDFSKDTVMVNGIQYDKYKVDETVEKTLSSIIIDILFNETKYSNSSISLIAYGSEIKINGSTYSIRIDVGGGYNELSETMLVPEKKEEDRTSLFAIKIIGDSIVLTPLSYGDGPVAIKSGDEIVLPRPYE